MKAYATEINSTVWEEIGCVVYKDSGEIAYVRTYSNVVDEVIGPYQQRNPDEVIE